MKSAFGCVACYFGEAGAYDSGLVDRNGVMAAQLIGLFPASGDTTTCRMSGPAEIEERVKRDS
jgi:hypothetical protein